MKMVYEIQVISDEGHITIYRCISGLPANCKKIAESYAN